MRVAELKWLLKYCTLIHCEGFPLIADRDTKMFFVSSSIRKDTVWFARILIWLTSNWNLIWPHSHKTVFWTFLSLEPYTFVPQHIENPKKVQLSSEARFLGWKCLSQEVYMLVFGLCNLGIVAAMQWNYKLSLFGDNWEFTFYNTNKKSLQRRQGTEKTGYWAVAPWLMDNLYHKPGLDGSVAYTRERAARCQMINTVAQGVLGCNQVS